ncbi:MAG: flippase [Anaerolineae bacterium]|nr:flippase [Anaerolineae bacterium]
MARLLGSEGLGRYSLGISLVMFSVTVSTMGLTGAAQRFLAAYNALGEHGKVLAFMEFSLIAIVLLSTAFGGVTILGRNWLAQDVFHDPALADHLCLFGVLIPLSALTSFLMEALTGYQKVATRTIIDSFLRGSTKACLAVALVMLGWGLNGWILGEMGGVIVSGVLGVWLVRRSMPCTDSYRSFRFRTPAVERGVVSFAAVMLAIGMTGYAFQQLNLLITGLYLDTTQVGLYAAAASIGALVPSTLAAINSIFAPIVAELRSKGEHSQLTQLFQTLTKWLVAFTWPLAVVVVVFSSMIMRIYGAEFEKAASVLAIIAVGQTVNVATGSVGVMLVMSGYQRLELICGICTGFLSVALSIVLIPEWGIFGAGLATAVGQALVNLVRVILVRRVLYVTPYDRSAIKLIPAIGLSSTLVIAAWRWLPVSLRSMWVTLPIVLILSFSSFLLALAAQGIDSNDREMLHLLLLRIRTVTRPKTR